MEAVLSLLSAPGLSLKLVRPKALLDNCFRVMELLYCPCCKELGWMGLGQGARCQSLGRARTPWAGPLLPRAAGHFWKPRWALGMGTKTVRLGLGTRRVLATPVVFFPVPCR